MKMEASSYATFALVILAAVTSSLAQPGNMCRGYDCPAFTSQDMGSYELRTMTNPTFWVETTLMLNDPQMGRRDSSTAFRKLFGYISGGNSASQKISMTVPVLTKSERMSDGRYALTMMFYLDGTAQPPSPTDSSVRIMSFPAGSQFYVKTFRKFLFWASNSDFMRNLDLLKSAINNPSLYEANTFYTAGYESPWFFGNRRYEVLLKA